jgi:hypothetical protein
MYVINRATEERNQHNCSTHSTPIGGSTHTAERGMVSLSVGKEGLEQGSGVSSCSE